MQRERPGSSDAKVETGKLEVVVARIAEDFVSRSSSRKIARLLSSFSSMHS